MRMGLISDRKVSPYTSCSQRIPKVNTVGFDFRAEVGIMEKIIHKEGVLDHHEYELEEHFEGEIVKFSKEIFGDKSLYFDIKKRIGEGNILSIPDAYLLDFTFENNPRLYIIENEIATHDPYKHIGQQLLRFAISYRASGRKLKQILTDEIMKDKKVKTEVEKRLKKAGYRNIDNLLDNIIFDKETRAIVVIDKKTEDLENVLSQLSMKTDIIEFQTFKSGKHEIHKFTPFQPEIRDFTEGKKTRMRPEDIDTIVVPANENGFEETFIGENCWYSIRISASMLENIKYIAA